MTSILVLFPMAELNPRTQLHGQVLQEAGYDVEAVCWRRDGEHEIGDSGSIPTRQISVDAGRESLGNLVVLPIVWALFLLAIVRRRPDVIYCPHVSLLPVTVAGSLLTRARFIYDVQELFTVAYGDRDSRGAGLVAGFVERIERFLSRFADGVLTIDSRGGQLAARYGKHTTNVETVYNVPVAKQLAADDSDEPVVAFIGTIVEERGVVKLGESVLKVRERVPDVQFWFIGPVRDDSRERVESLLEETGHADAVEFLGKVPFETIHDHLEAASVGAAPYQPIAKFRESRGNARKLFDYMNAGLPILGPERGGIGEFIEELDCGVTVDTTDPSAIADALVALLTDDEWGRRLGQNGRQAVESRYAWEYERQKVISVVDAAVSDDADDRE